MADAPFVLTIASAPLPRIIAAVASAVAEFGGNIAKTHQHWDRPADRFFLRIAFLGPAGLTVPAVERFGLDLKAASRWAQTGKRQTVLPSGTEGSAGTTVTEASHEAGWPRPLRRRRPGDSTVGVVRRPAGL